MRAGTAEEFIENRTFDEIAVGDDGIGIMASCALALLEARHPGTASA